MKRILLAALLAALCAAPASAHQSAFDEENDYPKADDRFARHSSLEAVS